MRVSERAFEAYAITMLVVCLGLLAWSALAHTWVVGAVLNATGDNGTGWTFGLLAGLLAHVAAWLVLVVPVRYLSPKPTLREEIRNLPGELGKAMVKEAERRHRAEVAPDAPESRLYYRRLGLVGLGVGIVLGLGVAGGYAVTGRLLWGVAGIGLGFLLVAAWMLASGRAAGRG